MSGRINPRQVDDCKDSPKICCEIGSMNGAESRKVCGRIVKPIVGDLTSPLKQQRRVACPKWRGTSAREGHPTPQRRNEKRSTAEQNGGRTKKKDALIYCVGSGNPLIARNKTVWTLIYDKKKYSRNSRCIKAGKIKRRRDKGMRYCCYLRCKGEKRDSKARCMKQLKTVKLYVEESVNGTKECKTWSIN